MSKYHFNIKDSMIDSAREILGDRMTMIGTGGGFDYIIVRSTENRDYVLSGEWCDSSPDSMDEPSSVSIQRCSAAEYGEWDCEGYEIAFEGTAQQCLTFMSMLPAVSLDERNDGLVREFAQMCSDHYLETGEDLPYSTEMFDADGTKIVNPWMDETGRYPVDPTEYYGMAFTKWYATARHNMGSF